jgi:hypothetical protein
VDNIKNESSRQQYQNLRRNQNHTLAVLSACGEWRVRKANFDEDSAQLNVYDADGIRQAFQKCGLQTDCATISDQGGMP